jgi:hypothetical protein
MPPSPGVDEVQDGIEKYIFTGILFATSLCSFLGK